MPFTPAQVPPPNLGLDMSELLASGNGTDWAFKVEEEEMKVRRLLLVVGGW